MTKPELSVFGIENNHLVAAQDGFLLHQNTINDFLAMQQAALVDGIEIKLASSFRDFERQLLIWNNKFNGIRPVFDKSGKQVDLAVLDDWQKVQAILLYSAMPGTSRHHWGSDIDVYDNAAISKDYKLQLEPHEYEQGGPFEKLSNWLSNNAANYNFYRPYAKDKGGVAPELWHLSHISVATSCLAQFKLNADELLNLLSRNEICGLEAIKENFDVILQRFVYNVESPS